MTSEHIALTKPPVIIFGRPFVKRSPYAIGPLSVGAGHIVLDGFPALRERGTAPPPLLGPCLLWPRSPISAIVHSLVPKCLGAEVSWYRCVLGPKCPVTFLAMAYWFDANGLMLFLSSHCS